MADKFDATIITGSLDGKELENSIDALVKSVSGKTDAMATEFVKSMDKMKLAMKDFALTQKVSVDLMKDAWRNMSSSFDAMVAAQTNATSGGGKGGSKVFAPNTVGELEQSINALKLQRKELELNSDELRRQNTELERRKNLLSQQTKGVATQRLESATNMSSSNLPDAERKLRLLEILQRRYANTTELSVAQQNKLARAIQQTKDQIDKTKPKSLRDVLGMDENGIDAITKKMQALKRVQVAPNSPEATTLANEYQRLKKLQNDLLGQNAQLVKSNNYLAQSFGYIRNRLVYALTLGAITNFTKQIYEVRGQYELLERSLGVLVNSFQKGSQIFQELNDMAIKSPFTLMELATAAKQLTAYNFAADEVVDTTRRLADISAALGVPMERLTYNLGQIRAQTVLTARDARDFANAGLPMVKTLADYYTELEGRVVSTGDVYDRMSKKMVSYNDVMAVLVKMTDEGGKFFDFQAKQAETLKVQMNNLTLAWNNMLNEIGKDNQSLLELPLKGLRAIFENWEGINRALTNLALILGTAKVAQLAFNVALGKGNIEQLRSITLMPQATAQNYQNALSKMEITKAQAKLMIATNRTNVALRAAIVNMGVLTVEEANAAATTNVLRHSWVTTSNLIAAGIQKIGKSIGALLANPATWFFAITYAATDLYMAFKSASEAADEFNETIGRNTKENAESIGKFFADYAKSFDKLRDGKMEQAEQVKLWEAIREEIKKSSQNADEYISKLERMTDLSEKNKLGGDILSEIKQIQESANAAQEQGIIKASESVWGGLVQHGVVEQLKDLTDEINDALSDAEDDFDGFASKYQKILDVFNNPDKYVGGSFLSWEGQLASDTKAFSEEFDKFTKSIADSMEQMWNPNVEKNTANVREYVNTIVKAYKEAHPEIKGQLERVFDIGIDRFVANQIQTFAHVTDQNEILLQNTYSAWKVFYEKLRTVGGREFDGLMEYVTKSGNYSSKELEELWKKAAESMKRDAGDAYMTIDKYIADLNTKKVIIPIFFQQKQAQGDELQKDFEEHFIENSLSLYGDFESEQKERLRRTRLYKDLNKKDGEDTVKWNKRLNDLYNDDLAKIAKQDEIMSKITDKESVRYKEAKETKDFYEKQVGAIKEVVEYEGFSLEQKKKNGRKGSSKDLVLEALKNEIDLIKKAQSEYEKLTKDGASANDALATLNGAFGKTVTLLNSRLASYGLPLLDLKNVVKGNPKETLAFLEKISKSLTDRGLSNLERMKVVEVVIEEFKLKAKSFDLKQITEGLKRELDKRKDEYELALMLDNNPETRDIFADFMQIDKKTLAELPRSYSQLVSKLQESVNKLFKENDVTAEFDLSKMINKDNFEKWVKDNGHTIDDAMVKSLDSIRNYLTNLLNEETKQLGELVSKYGEAHAKIEKIYAKSTRSVLSVISTYGDENEKAQGLNLANQISLSDDTATIARLRNELNTLATKVADKSDAAQNLLDAIFKNTKENVAKTLWEGFKGGDYYSIIFDDLSRASTAALQGMKAQLDGLKDQIKESPESMKAFMSAYSKLRTELIERDPFKGIADGLNAMRIAHQQVIVAMAELDVANQNVEKKEHALNELRKKEPNNIVKIYQAEKELAKAKKNVADKTAKVVKAQNDETASQNDYKKAIKEANTVIKKLADSLKEIGGTLDNTTGNVIKFIGDILNFVTFVSDSMTTVSQNASRAIQAIEKASVILAIISAAIQLIQELNSLIPDSYDQYEKAAKKQAEINKLTDAIVQYQLAVLAARMEEENWFSESSMKKLKDFYSIGSKALDAYNTKLFESQAIYQNQQSGGWLTKFAYWTNPATWIKEITGIEGKWADAIALVGSGLMGAEAQMGQLGIWLTQHVNKDVYDYEEGFTAAITNLRIETKARSKGFLGTGIGGHAQKTDDLVEWVKRELGLDLFDKDFMLNEEAYKVLMDKYADKLVGETKATLEALHDLQEKWNEYIEQLQDYVDSLYSPLVDNMTDALWSWYDEGKSALTSFREYASDTFRSIVTDMMKTIILSKFAEEYANDIKDLYTNYAKGGISEEQLITAVADRTGQMMEDFNQSMPVLESLMNTAGEVLEKYGISLRKGSGAELTQLQQGIQSITESTAGAIEAYMNILNQRVFYHGTILEQIRDVVVTMNFDAQLGILAQMLLQLQNNYIVMQSMQSMMENWTVPSGSGIRVELMS